MRTKRKPNIKKHLNRLLLDLTGSKTLAALWWKSPNKGLDNATPISLWKGSTSDKWEVRLYIVRSVLQEGS